MMKGGSSGPTPDPAIGDAAAKQAELGEKWLAFSKEQFAISNQRQTELDALTKRVTEQQLGLADKSAAWATADRERYEQKFRPIEDQFVAEATNYATPEKQAAAAAEAKADVQSAAAMTKDAAARSAAGLGLNPLSGRWAAMDRATDLSTTLATAGAENTARQSVRDKGLALKADVVNLGRGLPAQSASAASLGLSSGSSAIGLNQGNQNLFNSSVGIVGSGYGGAMTGYGNQASTLQGAHNSALSAWSAQQQMAGQNMAGLGSAVGGLVGFLSDENTKTDKTALEDGEALDALRRMPVERWKYKPGIADEGEHVGPYAQDFAEQTGAGDGHTIPVQDAIGLTMAAVKDIDRKLDKVIGLGARPPARPSMPGQARKAA